MPTELMLRRCLSAAFLDHGDLSRSPADANGLALAHVYGEPPNAIAVSDKRLTGNEAERIARLPELVELERDRNRARSRRKPQPFRVKPVTLGDLVKSGKLLEVHCSSCQPARHLYIDAGSLDLPRRMPSAGGGQPSRLQRLWRQERGHRSSGSGPAHMRGCQELPAIIRTLTSLEGDVPFLTAGLPTCRYCH
jgi:hypothetical protein